MSQADRAPNNVEVLFHPVSHYDTPRDVLRDARLSSAEKRVILSSWASDMYAVDSHPGLRKIPGVAHEMRLEDILGALKQLDDDPDPPPPGGTAMRLPRFSKLDCYASDEPKRFTAGDAISAKHQSARAWPRTRGSRWTREANVLRYRRLLKTQLTDLERSYVERRLAEELRG